MEQIDLEMDDEKPSSRIRPTDQGLNFSSSKEIRIQAEDKAARINQDLIRDHKLDGDDVKEIKRKELEKMDRLQRFEYRFPFYKMDVNGFVVHVKQALKIFQPDRKIFEAKCVDL